MNILWIMNLILVVWVIIMYELFLSSILFLMNAHVYEFIY